MPIIAKRTKWPKKRQFYESIESDKRNLNRYVKKIAVMFIDQSRSSADYESNGLIKSIVKLYNDQKVINKIISRFNGVLIKTVGDTVLVTFKEPGYALLSALEIIGIEKNKCIGIGYGKILKLGHVDVFGKEVNRASFLSEDYGGAGEVLLTKKAYKKSGISSGFDQIKINNKKLKVAYRYNEIV